MQLNNTVKITVAGQQIVLKTDEEPQRIKAIADSVDKEVTDIIQNGRFISSVQAAVLCAMKAVDKVQGLEEENKKLKEQLRLSLEDSAKAKGERDKLKRELAKSGKK